jgi:hypothetical protein
LPKPSATRAHLADQGEIGRRASLSIKYEFIPSRLPDIPHSRCVRWGVVR